VAVADALVDLICTRRDPLCPSAAPLLTHPPTQVTHPSAVEERPRKPADQPHVGALDGAAHLVHVRLVVVQPERVLQLLRRRRPALPGPHHPAAADQDLGVAVLPLDVPERPLLAPRDHVDPRHAAARPDRRLGGGVGVGLLPSPLGLRAAPGRPHPLRGEAVGRDKVERPPQRRRLLWREPRQQRAFGSAHRGGVIAAEDGVQEPPHVGAELVLRGGGVGGAAAGGLGPRYERGEAQPAVLGGAVAGAVEVGGGGVGEQEVVAACVAAGVSVVDPWGELTVACAQVVLCDVVWFCEGMRSGHDAPTDSCAQTRCHMAINRHPFLTMTTPMPLSTHHTAGCRSRTAQ